MPEQNPSAEVEPRFAIGDEVLVPYHDGYQPCVIVQLINEDYIGTSRIITEENARRLAFPGTTPTASLEKTGRKWSADEILDGFQLTFGSTATRDDIRVRFGL